MSANHSLALPGKGVLVTGCSSGIGRATAIHLARKGMTVFASVRRDTDARGLEALGIDGLVPLCPLDLSKPDQVAAAAERVTAELARRGIEGLFAFVSNAGGGSVAPIELLDVDEFRRELEVRLVAPVALLQRLLPELRRGRGRVVWIATPAILPIPFVASIHACDFALNCLARTLELELRPWSIPSIQIRCGGIQTAAPERSARALDDAIAKRWPKDRVALYAPALERLRKEFASFDASRTAPEAVAAVVEKALRARKPARRYQVGHMSRAAWALELLPQPAQDLAIGARPA